MLLKEGVDGFIDYYTYVSKKLQTRVDNSTYIFAIVNVQSSMKI
jgi:hypothetical protein